MQDSFDYSAVESKVLVLDNELAACNVCTVVIQPWLDLCPSFFWSYLFLKYLESPR